MPNPQSALDNEMHKILWDFEIQTDHLTSGQTTRPSDSLEKRELAELLTLLFLCHIHVQKYKTKIRTCEGISKYTKLVQVRNFL